MPDDFAPAPEAPAPEAPAPEAPAPEAPAPAMDAVKEAGKVAGEAAVNLAAAFVRGEDVKLPTLDVETRKKIGKVVADGFKAAADRIIIGVARNPGGFRVSQIEAELSRLEKQSRVAHEIARMKLVGEALDGAEARRRAIDEEIEALVRIGGEVLLKTVSIAAATL